MIVRIKKIISGGQTGADRAALDFALEQNIPCGGWCPKGRLAEDGEIAPKYPLKETERSDYPERTRMNVIDSDGTLLLSTHKMDSGSKLTFDLCESYQKPCLILDPQSKKSIIQAIEWIETNVIRILNVAGSRESNEPGLYMSTYKFLNKLLSLPG